MHGLFYFFIMQIPFIPVVLVPVLRLITCTVPSPVNLPRTCLSLQLKGICVVGR